MAHSPSALKRWRQSLKRRERNRSRKSKTRTLITKARIEISNDPQAAEATVREAISSLDQAAQKGVMHINAAARTKSRLLKHFNLATASAVAAAASKADKAATASAEKPKVATRRTSRKATEVKAESTPPEKKPARTRAAAAKAAPKSDKAPSRARKSS